MSKSEDRRIAIQKKAEINKDKTWQDELIEKYPKLLEHCYPGVNEGWKDLLDNMCGCIQHYMKYRWEDNDNRVVVQDGEEPPENQEWIHQPFFSQIKEKFGSLRAYYYGGDEHIRGIVDTTEGMSHYTCEECGNKGEEKPTAWIKTLCDDCFENYEQIRQARWEK